MKLDEYINGSIGKKFNLSKIVIIGPYPTKDFFDQLVTHLPKKIVLIVDDGWPQDRLQEISDACKAKKCKLKIQRVASYNTCGLVHAKLYYFEWKNVQGNYTKRIMLAGSANASTQGFGIHAESFVNIDFADITKENSNSALNYLEELELGNNVELQLLTIGQNKSWISLPALRVVGKNLINGFDAWLRRGKLSHKYQPDPTFGRLILRLKKPMPKTAFEKNLSDSGFIVSGDPQSFSQPYVSYDVEGNSSDNQTQTWREKLFIETDYGYWTSGECYSQRSAEFVASKKDEREQAINKIIKSADHQEWINSFIESLNNAADRLNETQLSEYFELRSDEKLNINIYRDKAKQKLEYDQQKANDEYFQQRFISGFAFPPMPQFGDEFSSFAISFCNNLLAKMKGNRVKNKLAKILLNELDERNEFPESGEKLYKFLRDNWDTLRSQIVLFHQ